MEGKRNGVHPREMEARERVADEKDHATDTVRQNTTKGTAPELVKADEKIAEKH